MSNSKSTPSKGARSSNSGQASSMAELMGKASSNFTPLKKGDAIEGTIKKLTALEILVDIGAKGDALVLEYDKKNLDNLLALLHVGDRVTVTVLSPESEEGFPVVSLRRTLDEIIFSQFEKSFVGGQDIEVTVLDSTRGGYFVQTAQGIRGFLPNSQVMSDTVSGKVKVKIIEYDKAKKRLIFSQKATEYQVDPEKIEKQVKKDSKVEARVTSVTPYGMYVEVTSKSEKPIEGFIHISEVSYDRIENLAGLYKKDDKITAQVIDIDKENRRVNLSIKKLESDSFDKVKDSYKKEQKVKGTVKDVKSRGITIEIEKGVTGFIPAEKVPASKTYTVGEAIEAEVTDFDVKRRVILLSPVLTAVPVGYR